MSYTPRPQVWSFKAGRKRFNRVCVFAREGVAVIMMEWNAVGGGRALASLTHGNRERAKVQAMEKAAELARARGTHRPTDVLLAMRGDIERVAKLQGCPPGFAPSREFYDRHGRYRQFAVCAAFRGWRKHANWSSGGPRDGWGDAMGRFGFKLKHTALVASYAACAADVRRVAMGLGNPRVMPGVGTYRKLGKFSDTTVRKYMRLAQWPDVAAALQLEMSARRIVSARDACAKLAGIKTRPNHDSERAA